MDKQTLIKGLQIFFGLVFAWGLLVVIFVSLLDNLNDSIALELYFINIVKGGFMATSSILAIIFLQKIKVKKE